MSKWKIRRSTLDIVMLCISFYELTGIPHSFFLVIKYAIIGYLIILHYVECTRMKPVGISILLYGGVTCIATLINQTQFNRYAASFVYMLHILAIYVTIFSFIRSRGTRELAKCLIKILLCFLVATDVLMVFINYDFLNPSENYLIGNKFAVSYLHCFTAALIFLIADKDNNNSKKKTKRQIRFNIYKFLFLAFSIGICIRVTCTTGMLICIFMGVMMYLPIPQKFKELVANPKFIIALTAVVNVLILGSFSLFTNPYIANFISGVLGKSYTWTGRIHIYAIIMGVIKVHPWIGYGYFSDVIEEIMGFGNAQNGVLKILVDSGWIGLIGYTFLVYFSLKNYRISSRKAWSLIVFVYCMILASIAEINLTDYLFFMATAMIVSFQRDSKRNCVSTMSSILVRTARS